MTTQTATKRARSNEAPRDDTENLLFQFSEWVDSEGLMCPDVFDQRSHENLVRDFVEG